MRTTVPRASRRSRSGGAAALPGTAPTAAGSSRATTPATPPLGRERIVRDARFSPDGRRVATTCASGEVLLWDIEPDHRPLADLARMAEVLSGTRLDAAGAGVPITTEELREAYGALRD